MFVFSVNVNMIRARCRVCQVTESQHRPVFTWSFCRSVRHANSIRFGWNSMGFISASVSQNCLEKAKNGHMGECVCAVGKKTLKHKGIKRYKYVSTSLPISILPKLFCSSGADPRIVAPSTLPWLVGFGLSLSASCCVNVFRRNQWSYVFMELGERDTSKSLIIIGFSNVSFVETHQMIEVEGPSGPKSATLMPAFPPRSKTWAPWWGGPVTNPTTAYQASHRDTFQKKNASKNIQCHCVRPLAFRAANLDFF